MGSRAASAEARAGRQSGQIVRNSLLCVGGRISMRLSGTSAFWLIDHLRFSQWRIHILHCRAGICRLRTVRSACIVYIAIIYRKLFLLDHSFQCAESDLTAGVSKFQIFISVEAFEKKCAPDQKRFFTADDPSITRLLIEFASGIALLPWQAGAIYQGAFN